MEVLWSILLEELLLPEAEDGDFEVEDGVTELPGFVPSEVVVIDVDVDVPDDSV